MPVARDSLDVMSAKHQFSSINQQPKFNSPEHRNSLRPMQKSPRDVFEHNPTRPRRNSNPGRSSEKERLVQGSAPSGHHSSRKGNPKPPPSLLRRTYRWCAQCCGRKKSTIQRGRRKKRNCLKRLRDRWYRRPAKKRTSFKDETTTPTQKEEEVAEILAEKWAARHATIGKVHVIDDLPEDEGAREIIARDPSTMTMVTSPSQAYRADRAYQEDQVYRADRAYQEDQVYHEDQASQEDQEYQEDQMAVAGHPPAVDFTKSCCYLCAKNTMAIAAAMANTIDKLDVSIQASTKEMFTSDKSCSPSIKVRTVQSSVKVKTRDMSTYYQDEKKDKRILPKIKLKKLNNMLPKMKIPTFAKTRNVACETDKSIRCNNIPQCRAKRRTHCVTEADVKHNNFKPTETQ